MLENVVAHFEWVSGTEWRCSRCGNPIHTDENSFWPTQKSCEECGAKIIEARPIDANALLAKFRRRYIGRDLKYVKKDAFCAFWEFRDIIQEAPTIAGVSLKRTGKWIVTRLGFFKAIECSACGWKVSKESNYCPSCGADRMESSDSEENTFDIRPIDARALVGAINKRFMNNDFRYIENDVRYTYWTAAGIIHHRSASHGLPRTAPTLP